ncbi:hypothetical protein IAR55_006150 [Kwoniella newhampshirensis]|uniref:Homologous-pairing protein 2 winged helix domain-containing protein n=1 Tax=Kwoniella newhampshirensis TaxID=1651941 RepID=A0AAW0YU21_9TREE
MPPKKEVKERPIKGDEAEEMVLNYMKEMNRPFASADVTANLKNKVPKAAAVKVLAALAEKGQLTVKPYGKQLIYLYNQSSLEVLDPTEMSSLNDEINETQRELDMKRKELKTLQNDLSAKEALPKTKELGKEIERIRIDNEITLKALLPFRGDMNGGQSSIEALSAEKIKKIDVHFIKWRKEWTERRKVYKELMDQLAESGQIQSTAVFEEDQGINLDDDEAKEVEEGEFCRPPSPTKRGGGMGKPSQLQKVMGSAGVKRSNTDESGNTSPADGKKRKTKR